jgi:hypothetical protein
MTNSTIRGSAASRFCCAVATIAMTCAVPASAAPAVKRGRPQPVKSCTFSPVTYVRQDRLPPVVRAAPSFAAPIIGRMTHQLPPGEDEYRGVDILVTAISGDFVKIEPVKADAEYGIAATPGGWLPFGDVYFVMQTSAGFARPDPESRQVYAIDDWVYRNMIVRLLDCRGEWLKLVVSENYEEDGEHRSPPLVTGWFRGFCGVEETTCDGVKGDNPK